MTSVLIDEPTYQSWFTADLTANISDNASPACNNVGRRAREVCVPWTDEAFCAHYQTHGNVITNTDNCGNSRTVACPSCSDAVKNQGETDVDCGDSLGQCPRCDAGKTCAGANSCASSNCVAGTCRAPTCTDGVQNQGEANIDCGGPTGCPRCATHQPCSDDTDCQSEYCHFEYQGNLLVQACGAPI